MVCVKQYVTYFSYKSLKLICKSSFKYCSSMYRIFIVAWGKPKQENRPTKLKWLLTEHHAPEISEDTVLRV